MDPRGQFLDCSECSGLNRVSETCGKPEGAQHAQLVLGETQHRIADRADDFSAKIVLAANVVENLVVHRIEQQAIDGKVAALDILLRAVAETNLVGVAAVRIAPVRTESSNFDAASLGSPNRNFSDVSCSV